LRERKEALGSPVNKVDRVEGVGSKDIPKSNETEAGICRDCGGLIISDHAHWSLESLRIIRATHLGSSSSSSQ